MVLQYSNFGRTKALNACSLMAGECTFKFLLMNPSDWLALAVMVLICLSHFKLFWMVMPKYFAESAFSSVCPCNWYVCDIVFRFCVTLTTVHLSGWKCMSQSCSHLPAASRSCWSFIASSLFFICLYMMLSSANKRRVLCWMYSARSFMNMRNNISPSTVPWGTPDVTGILLDVSPSRITVCVLSVRKSFIQWKALQFTPY